MGWFGDRLEISYAGSHFLATENLLNHQYFAVQGKWFQVSPKLASGKHVKLLEHPDVQ